MGDEQQRPPVPFGRGGSFPPGATPPTVAWTEHPVFDPAGGRHASGIPDSGVVWPGRRTLSRSERGWVGVIAVLLAGYLGLLVITADWAEHPWLASLAAVCGATALVGVVVSAGARRPARGLLQGWTIRRLPRPTRRALIRRLRAGDPGPPELRSWAAYWTCLSLQAPWGPALFFALAANSAAAAAGTAGPISVWRLVLVAAYLALVAAGVLTWRGRRRAAHRIADALDQLPPLPPRPASSS